MNVRTVIAAGIAAASGQLLLAPAAMADASVPSVNGDVLLVVGGIIAAIIIWFVIRGALNLSGGDEADDDKAGVGMLDGIDDDDNDNDKKKKK